RGDFRREREHPGYMLRSTAIVISTLLAGVSPSLRRSAAAIVAIAVLLTGGPISNRLRASIEFQAPPPATAPAPVAGSGPLAEAAPLVSKTLPNGLEIVVLEDHSIPLVTVELAVRNGALTEPPELNGLSHLYEHMFFKSNQATLNRADYLSN